MVSAVTSVDPAVTAAAVITALVEMSPHSVSAAVLHSRSVVDVSQRHQISLLPSCRVQIFSEMEVGVNDTENCYLRLTDSMLHNKVQ